MRRAAWLGGVVVVLAIIGAIAVLIVVPRATHSNALTVLTGSMTPEIPVGSVVLVRPVDPRTFEIDDIATYQVEPGKDAYITHRIVRIKNSEEPTTFIFKGDAKRGRDLKPVPADAVKGEVWFHIPYLGAIRDALHGKAGLSLLAMLVLGGYAISQLVEVVRDKRKPITTVDVEPVRIGVDRALLLAEIPTSSVFGTPPSDAAKDWGGVLLRQDRLSYDLRWTMEGATGSDVSESPGSVAVGGEGPGAGTGTNAGGGGGLSGLIPGGGAVFALPMTGP